MNVAGNPAGKDGNMKPMMTYYNGHLEDMDWELTRRAYHFARNVIFDEDTGRARSVARA